MRVCDSEESLDENQTLAIFDGDTEIGPRVECENCNFSFVPYMGTEKEYCPDCGKEVLYPDWAIW